MIFRIVVTFFVGYLRCKKPRYTWKEKLLISFAWMPKATVQAAIGGVLLTRVRDEVAPGDKFDEYEDYGEFLLTAAVLSVLISAPLGAILTNTLGPKMLECDKDDFAGRKFTVNPKTASVHVKGGIPTPLRI